MSQRLRAAVIGIGKLGRFHAEKYLNLKDEGVDLVAVADPAQAYAQGVISEWSAKYGQSPKYYHDYHELLGQVDLVTIATPSLHHFEVAQFFLQNRIHCLVEKPLALGLSQGQQLVELAKTQKVILAVGQSERYNPIVQELKSRYQTQRPLGVEFVRQSPFVARVTDVSVIDDLMIHDLDLLSFLFGADFKVSSAQGQIVRSSFLDACQVQMQGGQSTLVTLSAARILPQMTRTVRIWFETHSLVLDLQNNQLIQAEWAKDLSEAQISPLATFDKRDHLLLETQAYIKAVKGDLSSVCSGESVLPSLRWRDDILAQCGMSV